MIRLLLLMAVTVLAYRGLWAAGFVWDDIPLIVQNQALADWSIASIFGSDLWADSGAGEVASGYYRPLVLLSFAFDRAVFGLNPLGFHVHSLIWHLLAVLGLYRLCRGMIGKDAAFVGACLFALHPAQSEVVSWIAARNDLMAAAFGFFALGTVWGERSPSLWSWLGAMSLTVLSCLSKETAFVLPFLLLSADIARKNKTGMWLRCGALASGVLLVLCLRAYFGVGEAVVPSVEGWQLLMRSFVGWAGIMGSTIVSPWPVSSARDLAWVPLVSPFRLCIGLAFWAVLGWVAYVAKGERRRVVLMGCAWLLVLLAITLVPTADKGGFGDRFLYWPMAGLAVIVGTCCASHWKYMVPAIVVPALLILHVRLPDWQHDRSLWGAAIRDVPTPTNELSLGHALTLYSRHKRAHVNFVSAMGGQEVDWEACPPIVGSAMRSGLVRHAYRMGHWAIARGCPKTGLMNGWMATAAAMNGDWEAAGSWAMSEPLDPKGRARAVQAAIARRAGDEAEYAEIEAEWIGERPLNVQVEALVRAGER